MHKSIALLSTIRWTPANSAPSRPPGTTPGGEERPGAGFGALVRRNVPYDCCGTERSPEAKMGRAQHNRTQGVADDGGRGGDTEELFGLGQLCHAGRFPRSGEDLAAKQRGHTKSSRFQFVDEGAYGG